MTSEPVTGPDPALLAGLPVDPLRAVTDDEVETFWRDGVVCLRGILPIVWLDALADPLEQVLAGGGAANIGAMDASADASAPAFQGGVDHWRHDDMFRAFSCASPLGAIAAALLRSEQVWLWEDSVLVKEPGSPFETRFHTDAGYFHVQGDQLLTMWVPLDAATPETGVVRWVTGSHRDGSDYRPNLFVVDEPIAGTVGDVVPDVLGTPELAERVVTFDLEPGDLTVHHGRTLHGAPPNTSTVRRRAVSVRYCGDDVRYLHRPGLPGRPGLDEVVDGDPLAEPWCPQVWPR